MVAWEIIVVYGYSSLLRRIYFIGEAVRTGVNVCGCRASILDSLKLVGHPLAGEIRGESCGESGEESGGGSWERISMKLSTIYSHDGRVLFE